MSDLVSLLPDLQRVIRAAGHLAQQERKRLVRDLKPDGSIVTNGDKAAEEQIRESLCRLLPNAGIWGEEFGRDEEGPEGLWLIDPVDGTANYSFGSPLWGVSIGLVRGEENALGAVFLPDLDELYLCAAGNGVTCNGVALDPIPSGAVQKHELVSYGETVMKAGQLIPGRFRCSGAFVVDGAFVARQRYRGLVGFRERLYDVAPCALFGQELGAQVRYANGEPFEVGALKDGTKIDSPWVIFPKNSGFLMRWP